MTTTVDVQKELSRIADISRRDDESTQAFKKRVTVAYDKFSDAVLNRLSKEAYTWGENAVMAINDNRPIPDFDAPVIDTRDGLDILATPEPPEVKRGTGIKPGQMSNTARQNVGRPKAGGPNHTRTFREHFLRNMTLNRQIMLDKLFDEKNVSVGTHISEATVNATIYHTRQTVQLIKDIFGVDIAAMEPNAASE